MLSSALKGQIIWLTGASSGIGKDLLVKLLEQQAIVIASSRNLDNVAHLLQEYPESLTLLSVDVAEVESVKKCIEQIRAKYKHLDKVILNAGVCYYLHMPDFDADIIRKNFAVNFFGVVNCIEQAMPLLLAASNPHLIGMSSSVAYVPLPTAEGYGASKAAVLYMLRAMQSHKFKHKLDISIICPGFVETPLTARNTFPMPLLWTSKQAAKYILKGIIQRKTEISFPLRLVLMFKLIAVLPDFLRIAILSRIIVKG